MSEKEPKTGKEFVELAAKSGKAKVKRVSGSHYIVEFADGNSIPVPVHANKQLGKGLLHKIKKAFKAVGILLLVLLVLWLKSLGFPLP
ncbi:MAG: type II toxin-antitoxin system HicA family toxin [Chloroflexi bacterium]|nr:type II toxin-antitoxin system HicA family toxin [Chloroflexota bacterium]